MYYLIIGIAGLIYLIFKINNFSSKFDLESYLQRVEENEKIKPEDKERMKGNIIEHVEIKKYLKQRYGLFTFYLAEISFAVALTINSWFEYFEHKSLIYFTSFTVASLFSAFYLFYKVSFVENPKITNVEKKTSKILLFKGSFMGLWTAIGLLKLINVQ